MKKILFLAVASTIALGSCSSNDSEENISTTIVGVWKPSMEKVISGSNGNVLSTDNFDTCYKKSTFNFKANNTLTSNTYENVSGTCSNGGEDTMSYSYDYSNKKITIDGDEYEVISHTQNEFQLVGDYDDKNGDSIEDKIVLVLAR
ncbi:hypothetical protein ASG22_02455 [Chryseobacterium sp. Leaf405]|uniref:lipocalin family protein n=1 Tax=Chryseobacterium sp. Leaf405 TaxID=1736367 RepID=UPI0006F4ADD2|nr:lipocalin family protein [Chryseobacterium sp. Leaf405]KQT35900.1 hypothetical protein ASG22_02455 [Chryseobacterium sp. Leaf405]